MLSVKICFWCKNIVFRVNCSVWETVVLLYVFFMLIYKETSLCAMAILMQAVICMVSVISSASSETLCAALQSHVIKIS